MKLTPTKTVHIYTHGKITHTIEYFVDGRGQEVCRRDYITADHVVWQYRFKDDEPEWWRMGTISDQRELNLEKAYNKLQDKPPLTGKPNGGKE